MIMRNPHVQTRERAEGRYQDTEEMGTFLESRPVWNSLGARPKNLSEGFTICLTQNARYIERFLHSKEKCCFYPAAAKTNTEASWN